jgi:tRNA (guanine-N7-)-methyltransferase
MLLTPSRHPLPPDPAVLFGRCAPLMLEIGFGDGRFLVHLARRYPDWNILGAEVSMASVTRALRRLRRERVENVQVYKGYGRFLVRNLVPRHAVSQVWVNFPDPWPKSRHQDHRLLQASFFRLLSTRLVPGGTLCLTTDSEPYYRFAQAEGAASGCFTMVEAAPPPETLQTKYALKWQAAHRTFYHAVFTCTADAPDAPAPIETFPMQHALMEGSLEHIQRVPKLVHLYDAGRVVIADAYRALGDAGLLFRAVVEEEDLRQEVLLKAWPHPGGVYVGVERFGEPLVTRGLREALQALTAWLEGQGLRLVQGWM